MKNLLKITLFLGLSLFIATGCKDNFLDKGPLNTVSEDNVFSSETAAEAYLAALYEDMQLENFEYYVADFWNYQPTVTDIALRNKTWGQVSNTNVMPVNQYGWWGFSQIREVNIFIEGITETDFPQEIKDGLLAEAKFIRAFDYFAMVKRYGGVPIIEETQDFNPDDLSSLHVKRNTEKEVYDWIEQELNEATPNLPEPGTLTSQNRYRADKGAALALMSRAMLYAASSANFANVQLNGLIGIPSSEADTYYTKSYNASKELIDHEGGWYSLYDQNPDKAENYYELFFTEDGNPEKIFVEAFDGSDKGHQWHYQNTPQSFRIDWGSSIGPTVDLVESYEYVDGSDGDLVVNDQNGNPIRYQDPADLFENKDPRFFGTILFNGAPFQGKEVEVRQGIIDNGQRITATNLTDTYGSGSESITIRGKDGPSATGDPTKTGFYIRKYLNPSESVPQWRGEVDWIVFRYAEILLNHAEAAFELGGGAMEAEALASINKIRERAGIAELSSITREDIRHERKIELAFENHRLWDLRRWRIGTDVLNNTQPKMVQPWLMWDDKSYIFEITDAPRQARSWEQRMYWEAIPGNEIETNPNMVQNPLY